MPRFLVTAGNTRELIDRVRDWGNIFTGNTGYNIARELARLGQVDLLTSNQEHLKSASTDRIDAMGFRSHDDLMNAIAAKLKAHSYDAIFMTAAVADYRPAGSFAIEKSTQNADGTETWIVRDVQAGKVKSTFERVAFAAVRTEKIVDKFRRDWGYKGLLFKFKLEVGLAPERLIEVATKSRTDSGADYIIANTLDMVSGDSAGAYLIDDHGPIWVARSDLAATLARAVSKRLRA